MIVDEAKRLGYHDWIHSTSQTQGGRYPVPLRVRVNGQPQTWKRDPSRVRVPIVWGDRTYGQLYEFDIADWHKGFSCDECKQRLTNTRVQSNMAGTKCERDA